MREQRQFFFLGAAVALAVVFAIAFAGLPAPGKARSRYAEAVNAQSVPQRHVTDVVTAVNFDFRGFDTLGEEFILFVSVMGALVLLREPEEKKGKEQKDRAPERRLVRRSNALEAWTFLMTGPTLAYGLYIVLHGQLTPGGGFQGGVILATAPLLIYLAGSFETFKRVTSHRLIAVTEAAGVAAYLLIGMLGLLWGKEYLANVLPLGRTGELTSGGTVPLISFATGMEVTGGLTLLMYAFLQKTLQEKEKH